MLKKRVSTFYFFSVPIRASQLFIYPWLMTKITTLFEHRENWLQTAGSITSMEEPGELYTVVFALIATGLSCV